MTASGRRFNIARKAASNSSEQQIITRSIVVPSRFAGKPDLFEERLRKGIGRIGQGRHAAGRREHLPDQFDTFAGQVRDSRRDSGDVTARPGQAVDQPSRDEISRGRHDRDFARRLLCRACGRREVGHDHIDFEPHELSRQFGKAACLSLVRSELEPYSSSLD